MSGGGIRAKRVAESIRAHLTTLIARELGDPRLSAVVVTHVGVPDDLGVAWVSVRRLVSDDDPAARRELLAALRGASPRLRRALGPAVRLKRVPELRFDYDTGHDAVRRVEELLREVQQDEQRGPREPTE